MENRYSKFLHNGSYKRYALPVLNVKKGDFYETYTRGMTSLCNLSYKYYGDPGFDWLILLANREYGSLEYAIPSGSVIRIPYPLDDTLYEYSSKLDAMLTSKPF